MSIWDFIGDDTNELTHDLHLYPAKLNPHVARRLIKYYGSNSNAIWDPFCGSGTTLVEGRLAGLDVFGNDINPIALEISIVKTQNYDIDDASKLVASVIEALNDIKLLPLKKAIKNSGFTEEKILDWFTAKNVQEISTVFHQIEILSNKNQSQSNSKQFVRLCLSDCIRTVSFQRDREWKLYRVEDWRDGKIDGSLYVPLFPLLVKKLESNLESLVKYSNHLQTSEIKSQTNYHITKNDCVKSIVKIKKYVKGFDLVITSPPYGDSPTTMAYEQFSWLPNVWLGLDNRTPGKLAKEMLGGVLAKSVQPLGHRMIDKAISKIKAKEKEGRSIKEQENLTKELQLKNYSFYRDYLKSIKNIASLVNPGGYVCFILGNRVSGGQEMRLDLFTDWAFKQHGFTKVGKTKKRNITNTRMPKSNPSGSTMNHEYIVVLKKTSQ
jgi:site-specific DNA-methyltransferase (cytosine-N4-specific)